MKKEIIFKAISVKDRQPQQFGSIHFVLLDGRLPMMAQYNPQGWCYLSNIPAKEPPKVIGGVGVSHWLELQQESMVKAIFFEKAAIERGLKIGFKKDFQWVESLDDRIWCLLTSKSAIDFANSLNLEKEAVEGGAYLIYFSG